MTLGSRTLSLLLPLLMGAVPAAAQQWTADVYAGGTQYGALSGIAGATNVAAGLRFISPRISAYVSGAAPVDGDAPLWSALGAAADLRTHVGGGFSIGMNAGADAYGYRYPDVPAGAGVTLHALPLFSVQRGPFDVQLRGGRRDHHSELAGNALTRRMYEAELRATHVTASTFSGVEARTLMADDATYTQAEVQLATAVNAVRLWGSAGRWFGDATATVWGAGAAMDIGGRGELWVSAHRDLEPLYSAAARTSWNVGYSIRLGRSAPVLASPVARDGVLVIRLPRDGSAAPSVAGEFSDWQPLPMRAAGNEWLIEVPAGPGVYRFSFVSTDGRWFVPEGYPGRMDDDMGGHVAVVVVQ